MQVNGIGGFRHDGFLWLLGCQPNAGWTPKGQAAVEFRRARNF